MLRADRGTENANIAFLQPFLRRDGEQERGPLCMDALLLTRY